MKVKNGIMINIDSCSSINPFINELADRGAVTEADLYPIVDPYANTQVTDLFINTLCQYSNTPSKVFNDATDKYLQKEENGETVDYTDWHRGIYILNTKLGIDPFDVWFRRTWEKGMRPWLSVRMNDCHYPDAKTSFLRSDFFYEAKEKGYMIGSEYGYHRYCLNYKYAEVRQKFLDYIREQIERYDVYGLELDFQREIYCFDYIHEPDCHRYMTEFLRDAKAQVKECEKKWGHPIKIAIRLMRDIAQNKSFGFDVPAMTAEHLVDTIVVTPRFSTSDSNMPIGEWVKAFPDTDIVAGVETCINRISDKSWGSPEVVRGFAATYMSEGSNGIYLYNYFWPQKGRIAEIYPTCGYIETVLRYPRRHVVTYQDIAPVGYERWKPLPLIAKNTEISINIGVPSKIVSLVIGLDSESSINAVDLEVNSVSVGAWSETCRGYEANEIYAPDGAQLYITALPEEAIDGQRSLALSFNAKTGHKAATIVYIEADTY